MLRSLVGSEMCIRDRVETVRSIHGTHLPTSYSPDLETLDPHVLSDSERNIRSRSPLPDDTRYVPDTPAGGDSSGLPPCGGTSPLSIDVSSPVNPVPGTSAGVTPQQDGLSLPAGQSHPSGTPMAGGPNDPRFHNDEPKSNDDVVAMDIERRGGESLLTPTR